MKLRVTTPNGFDEFVNVVNIDVLDNGVLFVQTKNEEHGYAPGRWYTFLVIKTNEVDE